MTLTDVQGLFYQNDMEPQHAKEKRMQCFKTDHVMQAVRTIETMIQRQEDEERAALYGSLHHVLAPAYKQFYSEAWHKWNLPLSRKSMLQHYERLQSLEDTFSKPGWKPSSVKRIRKDNVELPLIIVDRTSTATAQSSFAATNSASGAFNLSSVVA